MPLATPSAMPKRSAVQNAAVGPGFGWVLLPLAACGVDAGSSANPTAMPTAAMRAPAVRRRWNGRPSNQQRRPTPTPAMALASCAGACLSAISMQRPEMVRTATALLHFRSLSWSMAAASSAVASHTSASETRRAPLEKRRSFSLPSWVPDSFQMFKRGGASAPAAASAAAAAAAAAATTDALPGGAGDVEMVADDGAGSNGVLTKSETTGCAAFGVSMSVENAYAAMKKAGLGRGGERAIPVHIEAHTSMDTSLLTVFAAEHAVRHSAPAGVAVQRLKKRGPDGDQQMRVGWAVL